MGVWATAQAVCTFLDHASGTRRVNPLPQAVEAVVPAGGLVHAIPSNHAFHEHPKVRAWHTRRPHWTFHLTPTSASWLNAVKDSFPDLTRRRLRRGPFTGLVDSQR